VSIPTHIQPGSPSWPERLVTISSPPEELWMRGCEEILARERFVAIVGSRAPTPYGEAQARRFGAALAAAGIVVVSGLARGVDSAAHRGALEVGGATIAVLGCGVDRPWPAGPLAEDLVQRGLLLSEFPPGMGPRRHHFPLRNRIISGLSQAVLVVEAAWASGSLITARWGVEQGRSIYALPGRVDHPMARGAHRLIREGATLIDSPEELARDLYGEVTPDAPVRGTPVARDPLLEALVGETLSVDELSARLVEPVGEVLASLATLELSGRVARCPGGLYRLS
jgi:DNA processing protein